MSEWKNLPVLITGADGFIGSHLTQRLVEMGADVSIVLRGDKSQAKNISAGTLDSVKAYQFDIRDFDVAKQAIRKIKPRKVFHLAAFMSRATDPLSSQEMFQVNVIGMLNIITLLEKDCYDCFMQFGTAGEYGGSSKPLDEKSPLQPNSPYTCSKASASLYCQMLAETCGLPIILARLFSVYGDRHNTLSFVHDLILSAKERRPFQMTHGNQTRDFIFISDVIEAILKLSLSKTAKGQTFNICSGTETRLKDFALAFNRLLKHPIDIHFSGIPTPKNEILRNCGDNSKIKSQTGWEPSVSLNLGIQKIIEYHQL